jgi:V/A-type H+-transporting ATPase subunit F|tara:strand:+ start:38 stop:334 length:297 start_codon:yes stop_codon:yes gene_type:complete
MKVITVGSRVFVTSFQLAGVQGKVVDTPENALKEIKEIYKDPDAGLILLSDDLSKSIDDQLTTLRAQKSTPLIFALPASGSEKSEVDYRVMLKKILGV